jgi:hypothetical protein
MTHLKYQPVELIASFELLGLSLICEDMTCRAKLMSLLRSCIEMGMGHGKPVNRSPSTVDHFNCR